MKGYISGLVSLKLEVILVTHFPLEVTDTDWVGSSSQCKFRFLSSVLPSLHLLTDASHVTQSSRMTAPAAVDT
jgi:hypothetical protein